MKKVIYSAGISLLFQSCASNSGVVGGFWKILPREIDDFGSFFKAFMVIFFIQVLLNLIARSVVGRIDALIAIILFSAILLTRNYGFLLSLLLFGVDLIVSSLFTALLSILFLSKRRNSD